MSYDSEKKQFNREHIYIVEIDLDYCSLTSGIAPCTATQTGDAKCFNTLASTNDAANYTKTTKTYRFYSKISPAPIGISDGLDIAAIPCIESVSVSPAEVDVSGGLGVRASASVAFTDFSHSDIGVDKYVSERTWIASDRGTFWTKLRARNPNYENRPMRVLSGYIVDGEFDITNFQTRYYVIDKMTVTSGRATLTGKDPLKLAMSKKAQVPKPSTGVLSGAITASATSATLTPSGVGNSEYPSSGKIAIDKEIIAFTRSGDSLTLTRAQNNTLAASHNANASVQLCFEKSSTTVNNIIEDILTNYCAIDSAFISSSTWQSEADSYLNYGLSGIIPKPTDANKVLKELSETAPHYLWWDERQNQLQFTALKEPPSSAATVDMESNIIAGSFRASEKPEKRISTVFVNYGQIDPTLNLDESANWETTYVRADASSISFYDNVDQIKVINSRWLPSTSSASARTLAALIGRRFANTPRQIDFALDAKDSDIWVGQARAVNHRDIVDFTGAPVDTIYQIIKAAEEPTGSRYSYSGLEYLYGQALPEDEGGGAPDTDLVIIDTDQNNINLASLWASEYPSSVNTKAKFVITNNAVVGSTSTSTSALSTGTFAGGFLATLQINSGSYVVGAGGDGAGTISGAAGAGGLAISLSHNLELINNGTIGGGGGGGGRSHSGAFGSADAAGGGGAGSAVGSKGLDTTTGGTAVTVTAASDGTLTSGGSGGHVKWNPSEPFDINGGAGGNLGSAGTAGSTTSGGAAGAAIDKNGHTLTETVTGTILGSIIP